MALPPQQFCVRWNSYHTNLQAVFPRLLLTEQFADVTLACESRQLRCHKLVLSACSAYLERLLLQNPCKHPIVLMRDMRFSEMQALVDFMYKGEVNVTQEELPSLLKSAEALQIRGLCSGEGGGAGGAEGADASRDFTLASDALLHAHRSNAHPQQPQQQPASKPLHSTSNGPKKRKSEEREREKAEVKEETVEEDGLYYGELDNDHLEYNEDDETGKPGSSLGQSSGRRRPCLRVKPDSELFFQTKLQNLEYMNRLSKMNAAEIQNEFSKYGLTDMAEDNHNNSENDYYKSWLEQNGELEVSLLKANQLHKPKRDAQRHASEVELIPRGQHAGREQPLAKAADKLIRKRGRPPIFKDKNVDIGETVLKADLDQFLEGKEVSSSGLSRKDLERVMMGKFNPNRRYSNEAMWAALMDVKKGGSIYRAAQTHKVPRKSLRNWMKRCHIKSSFPMPQQLKQFVENSKRQRETHDPPDKAQLALAAQLDFGTHFLSLGADAADPAHPAPSDDDAIDMSLHE
ncbi:protein tramtrack, beta isoform-like isoform X1 [Maniola jurtina]|uniref:protein tramtrack, beta isoform-like isoform X1 n=1 Tax=Maniola jurtina TaxID=191418 RepID=UPI001E68B7F0|nr:protein tramtrack, beta isoform-like isoform X1 [Maniola jurtina]XP_045771164.1 protein tramtrack, beta isoform-like isoform X1 [Maniola jurtina]XP_045771166.1 protein tramtrack, beta isoform-like isoform X1 [Maniola jurtina]XP_045771167.1 protein tramtrack, beta isoform-like isoform X2 [Maniola jurtina]XP_045771168.1 protein tramtrack, beta isoform-like isoform X1 [Maniola jurtina]XP_045771169.1 protein tramtrack, beta isoform-like isoform X1 [Maniola jurtina]